MHLPLEHAWGCREQQNLSVVHATGIRTTNVQTKHRQHHSTESIWRTLQCDVNHGCGTAGSPSLVPDRLGTASLSALPVQLHHDLADTDPVSIHDAVGMCSAMPCRVRYLSMVTATLSSCKSTNRDSNNWASTITLALACEPSSNNHTRFHQRQHTPTIQGTIHYGSGGDNSTRTQHTAATP